MVSEKLKNDFYKQAKINLNDFIKNPPKDNKNYQRKLRVIVELLNHSIQFEVEGDLRNIFMNFLYTQLNDLIILYETKKEETKEIKEINKIEEIKEKNKIEEIKEKILFLLEQFRDFTRLNNIESQNLYHLERIIEKLF